MNKALLIIDIVESSNETRAFLLAARALKIDSILLTTNANYTNDTVCKLASFVYVVEDVNEFKNAANKTFDTHPNIEHIITATDFLVPVVNDLILSHKLKYPIADKTTDILNLVDKFRFNEITLPSLNLESFKIKSWLIENEEAFDAIYKEYNGPIFVKINWGFSYGDKIREFNNRKYESVLDFKNYLISTKQLGVFLKDNIYGIKDKNIFFYEGAPFKHVIQEFINYDLDTGVYSIFFNNEYIGNHNGWKCLKQESDNFNMPEQLLNFNPNVLDNFNLFDGAFKKCTAKLNTSMGNLAFWYSKDRFLFNDFNLRTGGCPATLTNETLPYEDKQKALRPYLFLLSKIFNLGFNNQFATFECQPIYIGKIKVQSEMGCTELDLAQKINKVKLIFNSDITLCYLIKGDILLRLLEKNEPFKLNLDVMYFTIDTSVIKDKSTRLKKLFDEIVKT